MSKKYKTWIKWPPGMEEEHIERKKAMKTERDVLEQIIKDVGNDYFAASPEDMSLNRLNRFIQASIALSLLTQRRHWKGELYYDTMNNGMRGIVLIEDKLDKECVS